MKTDKKQINRSDWQSPQIKTLSISHDTQQTGPKDPPDFEQQVS
jgi:hypothetical protein